MEHGFIKVGAGTPKIRVADCAYNADRIIDLIHQMDEVGAKVLVLPELCITGYSCSDLFWQELLLDEAQRQLLRIAQETATVDGLIFVGLPLVYGGKLYNVAAALNRGKVLGFVPKCHIPNYNEFYEARHFSSGAHVDGLYPLGEEQIPISSKLLFTCPELPRLVVAAEICEDLWVPNPPSVAHVLEGRANLIVNLSASNALVGKDSYRTSLVSAQSARLICAYAYASAGAGESTQDVVYSGHNLIAENGTVLAASQRFTTGTVYADVDIHRLDAERRRMSTFQFADGPEAYTRCTFHLTKTHTRLARAVDAHPFVPSDLTERSRRCEDILTIQAMGLKTRLEHIRCRNVVLGLSGGLDSTLALLVTVRAYDLLGLPRQNILCVTMPCFGTTDRTYQNACALSRQLGTTLREVNIMEAVNIHFRDIGHDPENRDVTYENSQARERTQILMDLANQSGGIVIGTGDLSELALGWATYNGDHMSMYAVNVSVPKTLVRHLVRYYADTCGDAPLARCLLDVLDTPVSPELLPPQDGTISQKTEDLVGPYVLHDFFLYFMLRWTFPPDKIYRLAKIAFAGEFDDAVIFHWLKIFYRRFFAQQFKRSCLPDGPKVGSVAVSPRGDLRMPSDACAELWLGQLARMEP